jgi:hypothetical protein
MPTPIAIQDKLPIVILYAFNVPPKRREISPIIVENTDIEAIVSYAKE